MSLNSEHNPGGRGGGEELAEAAGADDPVRQGRPVRHPRPDNSAGASSLPARPMRDPGEAGSCDSASKQGTPRPV